MNRLSLILAATVLSACSQSPSAVRITNDVPASLPMKPSGSARSEPVFYNGKTYKLDMTPTADGVYSIKVSGMTAGQQKEALGLSSSAFHHFTCKDSQKANFQGKPNYQDGKWNLTAKCS